jgi:hypothetical protein
LRSPASLIILWPELATGNANLVMPLVYQISPTHLLFGTYLVIEDYVEYVPGPEVVAENTEMRRQISCL